MTLEEVKNHFGSFYRLSKQTGISATSTTKWIKEGYITIRMQLQIQKYTKGKLKASLDDIPADNSQE